MSGDARLQELQKSHVLSLGNASEAAWWLVAHEAGLTEPSLNSLVLSMKGTLHPSPEVTPAGAGGVLT